MKLTLYTFLLIAILVTACGNSNPSGQQIHFFVKDGTFTSLKIEGTDPDGQWKIWENSFEPGKFEALTKGYWWQGTVVLNFDIVNVGWRTCVIDYLRESGSTTRDIIFTEGQGCTGEGGSVHDVALSQVLREYTNPQDARQIADAAFFAEDALGCIRGIAMAIAGNRVGIIHIVDCAGASISIINDILSKYYLEVTDKPIPTATSKPHNTPMHKPRPVPTKTTVKTLIPTPTMNLIDTPVPELSGIERITGVWQGTVTGTSETGLISAFIVIEIGVNCGTGVPCLIQDGRVGYDNIPLTKEWGNFYRFGDFISGEDYWADLTLLEDGTLYYEEFFLPSSTMLKGPLYRSSTSINPPQAQLQTPHFTASTDMFCREGPSSSYDKPWHLTVGETVQVLARWYENNWLLVDINDSRTRTDCCWVGGDGTLSVPIDHIKPINFLPDRMDCSAVK